MRPLKFSRDAIQLRQQLVAEMTAGGLSAAVIADVLNVTPRQVVRDRAALGISQERPAFLTREQLDHAARLLDDGSSFAEVARTIRCDVGTVAHHFPGRGWTREQSGLWNSWLAETRRAAKDKQHLPSEQTKATAA
jgi:hypothetical protein